MKKRLFPILFAVCIFILLTSSAGAEWRQVEAWTYGSGEWVLEQTWRYYGDDGEEISSFSEAGMSRVAIPDEVDSLNQGALPGIGRDFVIECSEGSYAETFAKQYGYQYDNGKKTVVGYGIQDLEEKADWIFENYVEDNYKGSRLTDREKAKVLHDWLTTNATYDLYGLDIEVREHTFTAEGVLLDGTGVCDSYAQAYSYLLTKADILNRYISGNTDGETDSTDHAWDLVLIDGQWYHTDVTWDDPNGETAVDAPVTTGYENITFFLVSDEEMKELSRNRIWTDQVSADSNMVGFAFSSDGVYYFGSASDPAQASVGWQEIDNNDEYSSEYYWIYNPNTNAKQYISEGLYYFTEDGTMAVGWEDISGLWYYFDANGVMHVGWLEEEGEKYHLSDDGAMNTGWTDITGLFNVTNPDTGEKEKKYLTYTYYFGTDGKMRVGWVDSNEETYYLDEYGRLQKDAWIKDNGNSYHAGEDGTLDKGWKDITGPFRVTNPDTGEEEKKYLTYTYYFGTDGKMRVGWVDSNGETYYLDEYGRLQKGFRTVDNIRYYFDENTGEMQTGLFRVDGKLHYAESDGKLTDDLTEGFVARCYQLILGREADRGGLKDWSQRLKTGISTAAEIVSGFLNSQEFLSQNNTDEETVEVLYKTMLGRESDPAGKAGWASYLASGCSDGAVINGFCGSQEFMGICKEFRITAGSVSPETRDYNKNLTAFVDRCYRQALNRAGESDGLNYWCGEIISGSQTPKQVASGFVFSQEMADRNMNDEDTIDMLYRLYLGREPDPAGKEYWLGKMAEGMTLDQLNDGFADSVEFAGIVESYGFQ